MRINKYIADCGIASRRAAEELVKAGKIKINGKVVTDLSTQVNEWNDTVTLEGTKIKLPSRYTYLMLNKPKGCVSTVKDDKGRKTVMDYLPASEKRLFPVGRLDYDSEGLLLFTNDGDTAFRLTHPSSEIPKTYQVIVSGKISEENLKELRAGVVLDGVKTSKSKIAVKSQTETETKLEVTIYEGKNRQVRRMFESVGKEVVFLRRTAVGDLRLGGLGRGQTRYLKQNEIDYLKKC